MNVGILRMKITFSISFLFCFFVVGAQEPMHVFYNADSTLTGYRERDVTVLFKPRFTGTLHPAKKVDHVAAVMEATPDGWRGFHINRKGKRFGTDSIYMLEAMLDCKSEGHIRFRNPKTQLMGVFNRHGKVAIPARFNYIGPLTNGHAFALLGAKKDTTDIEHPSYIGGHHVLVDTLGNIVLDDYKTGDHNLLSLQKSANRNDDPDRDWFATSDGSFISMTDYRKEFKNWLTSVLLPGLTRQKLVRHSLSQLATWNGEWAHVPAREWLRGNFKRVRQALSAVGKQSECNISNTGLNYFIHDLAEFDAYLDNCGNARDDVYPVFSVSVPRQGNLSGHEDQFEFLRTKQGYRLISATLAQ